MAKTDDALQQGRRAAERRAWAEAHESLEEADRADGLAPADLELLATAAYMLGRDAESLELLERAHHGYLEAGDELPAIRCAFWIGINLAFAGEVGRATGWLGRAQRLLDERGEECAERGYAYIPLMFRHASGGDFASAAAAAGEAAAIGQRFGDWNLFALAAHGQGQMLIRAGQVGEGLALLDEAMVVATGDELTPIVTGLVYCGVILACREIWELRRAQEWTSVLTRWCEAQTDLVAFTGRCLVHRAEVLQVRGDWDDALAEARRAGRRLVETGNVSAAGLAFYRQGELLRVRGDFAEAEEAYRSASRNGWEPHPGLALLRLAQGHPEAAVAAIRRALGEATTPLDRVALLAAQVEIALATGGRDEARAAAGELEEIAEDFEGGMLGALVVEARGAVELADGDAVGALVSLRRACREWQELDAPYEVARLRVLVGLACRELGDEDSAALELDAAREAFAELKARPDLERLARLAPAAGAEAPHGLTARELEVVRLLAAGRSNREIAAELVISEHTVARHVQNILRKLRLSSRTAAAAFAFEHDLV